MAVDRAKIPQTHLFKDEAAAVTAPAVSLQRARSGMKPDFREGALETLLSLVRQFQCDFALGQTPQKAFKVARKFGVGRMGDELVEIIRNRADVFGNAPFVVVENADEPLRGMSDVV